MTRQRAFLAVSVLLLVGLAWFVSRDGGLETNAVEAPAPESRVPGMQETTLDAPALESPASDLATPASSGQGRVASAPLEFEVQALEPELAHLVGRFLLRDGRPPVGVTLRLEGWGSNTERLQKYGEPAEDQPKRSRILRSA